MLHHPVANSNSLPEGVYGVQYGETVPENVQVTNNLCLLMANAMAVGKLYAIYYPKVLCSFIH